MAVFGDAGAAWDRSRGLHFTGPDRDLVRSVGAAARINLLGFAVAEIDYVRPLDRPLQRMDVAVQPEAGLLIW